MDVSVPLNPFKVVWSAPDGRETGIGSDVVRIDVAEGVWIRVAFKMQDSAQFTVDLTLCETASGREGLGATGGRFVIIGLPTEAGRTRPVLSILRVSQEAVRIAAGPRRAERNAI